MNYARHEFNDVLHSIVFMKEQFCDVIAAKEWTDYDIKRWKEVTGGSFYADRSEAILPIIMVSERSPTNEKMNKSVKALLLDNLVVVNADQCESDHSECYNRPVRFIRSLDTANEPLTLEQLQLDL